MTSTPADRLRAAKARLRTLADAAERSLDTAPYWRSERVAGGTLDPAFGRAVADWLESAAEDAETTGPDHRALAVADLLLNNPKEPTS